MRLELVATVCAGVRGVVGLEWNDWTDWTRFTAGESSCTKTFRLRGVTAGIAGEVGRSAKGSGLS